MALASAVGAPWWAAAAALASALIVSGLSLLLGITAWRLITRTVYPVWALLRALLPLVLSAVVIALYATAALSVIAQIASGVVLAALIWLLLRGQGELANERFRLRGILESPRDGRQPRPWDRDALRAAGLVLIWLAAGMTVFFLLTRLDFFSWRNKAGASGAVEWLAVTLLAAAFWLRLYGYATSAYRWLSALLLLCFGGSVLIIVGVFPGSHWLGKHTIPIKLICAASACLLGLSLVLEAVRKLKHEPRWQRRSQARARPGPPPPLDKVLARRLGLVLASFAAFGFMFALSFALISTTHGPIPLSGVATASETTNVDVTGDGKTDDLDLAWRYVPVLHLHPKEEFPPVSVSLFLRGKTNEQGGRKIVDRKGQSRPLSFETLPVVCQDGGEHACGRIICGDRCSTGTAARTGWQPQGVIYARVLYRDRETDKPAFSGWTPPFDENRRLSMMIQYWIFYAYDKWESETLLGPLVQQHEGDWEHVTVGLAGNHKAKGVAHPLFVALSAHCGGRVVQWTPELPAAFATTKNGALELTATRPSEAARATHPIIAVAKGSHANYALAKERRPPDWGSCRDLPSEGLAAAVYASNIRDLTDPDDTGWFAYPRRVRLVTRLTRPMNYPGYWGAGEIISFGYDPAPRPSGGPKSPPLQGDVWNAPLRLYFCGGHWNGYGKGSKADCHPKPKKAK